MTTNEELKQEMEGNENEAAVQPPEPEVGGGGLFADTASVRRLSIRPQLALAVVLLAGVFAIGAVPLLLNYLKDDGSSQTANVVTPTNDTSDNEEDIDPWSNSAIAAEAAIVVDVRSGRVLFEREADKEWPLASLTKLMTALVAREIVDDGLVVPVTSESLSQSGESGLRPGELFSYKDFSDLVLMTSSNDGAYALAAAAGAALDPQDPAAAFVKAMNVRAKELGLEHTYFRNPTGLDISETEAGAYGTAREVAKLLQYLLDNYPEVLEETTRAESVVYNEAGEQHEAVNTNRVVDAIATVIASKTGYTTLAGGNLAVAFDAGMDRPVIVVVLGSSHQGRFSDVLALSEAARKEIEREK